MAELAEPTHLRRADNTERFVAFAFAAADLVLELEPSGLITYAAGAFRARLGEPPDRFVGRPVHSVIAPADHRMLDSAIALLTEKGRLAPLMVRLAASGAPPMALAGIALAPEGCPTRLCLTFGQAPAPLSDESAASPGSFTAMAAARVRADPACGVGFVELAEGMTLSSEALQQALRTVAPNSVASQLAPGRFGVLGNEAAELATALRLLEDSLRSSAGATVATHRLSLPAEGLTAMQAARALRQALSVFARGGQAGLCEAGFGGSLAGYVDKAAAHAAALRRAIKERRFELLFQPIVGLETCKLHHYEALLRPQPIKNCPFASPQEFVLLAETLGLVGELDLAVAELACAATSRAPAPIAFNASGQSIEDPKFREELLAVLASQKNPGRVLVEMTETAEVENLGEAARTAEALRALGVPFCLDDFGAGTADVRLLRTVPADHVKLDGSFVAGVAAGGRERAFVASMIEIAHAAGATVVAERVETEAEAAALRAAGATYGQGWLFGRPAHLPQPAAPARRRSGERESWG